LGHKSQAISDIIEQSEELQVTDAHG